MAKTLSDRLKASLDDLARCSQRHVMDDEIHEVIIALYSKLLARKRKADGSHAATRKDAIGT